MINDLNFGFTSRNSFNLSEKQMTNRLIHLAHIFLPKRGKQTLYLRQFSECLYKWMLNDEKETGVEADTIENAIQLGRHHWKRDSFKTLICGFRYNLPERDEHGMNALFYQLVASRNTLNGVYFDEELGHNCYIQNSSEEAILFLKKLTLENRL